MYKVNQRTADNRSTKSLLEKGLIPGIVYGKGTEPTKIAFENKLLQKLMHSGGFYSKILNIEVGGKIEKVLPKKNSSSTHNIRDSKDNCFSIYKSFFPNSVNFAFDMNEIVKYYNMYLDLINHWNNVLPKFIINIKYEKLIKNPELEINLATRMLKLY